MNRNTVARLLKVRTYPAVSILCPTHRTYPDNRRDPIQLKELAREARGRLLAEFSPREVEPVLRRLDELLAGIDHSYNLDGLALFASADFGEAVRLPFAVAPRVVVDETFATRDLLHALNRSQRYRVLLLNPRRTQLFEGSARDLAEVSRGAFPLEPEDEVARRDDAWWGVNPDAIHDERRRRFAREVAEALHPIQEAEPLPLVVTGAEPWISLFRAATRQAQEVIGTIVGNFPVVSVRVLALRAEPVVSEWRARKRERLQGELEAAVSANRYASGVDQVGRALRRAQGATLLVEEGYRRAARINGDGLTLEWAEDVAARDVVDDVVDESIEAVFERGGRVVFYPDGELARHQRIALILPR
jgi:hypothetical protein